MSKKEPPKPAAANLDAWLKVEGRTIDTWHNFAMLHQAKWHYARIKAAGVAVSVGAGPTEKAALQDVWDNLPTVRR